MLTCPGRIAPLSLLVLALPGLAIAGEADVVGVEIATTGEREFRFAVTVRHADAGWDHYADRWEVLGPGGEVLGVRELAHPHVDEQPFTRSLSGLGIPAGVDEVTVRARDSAHGYGGRTWSGALP